MYVVCQGAGDITVSLSGWVVETSDSDVVIGTSAEAGAKVQNSLLGKGGKSGSIDLRFIKVPLDSTALGPPKGLVWSSSEGFAYSLQTCSDSWKKLEQKQLESSGAEPVAERACA